MVSDYTFQKDRIFAYLTLSDDELMLYDKLYTMLEPQVPVPDLVLYLTADVDTCMERIRKRAAQLRERDLGGVHGRADRRLQPLLPLLQPLAAAGGRHAPPRTSPASPRTSTSSSHQLQRPIRGTEYFVPAGRK